MNIVDSTTKFLKQKLTRRNPAPQANNYEKTTINLGESPASMYTAKNLRARSREAAARSFFRVGLEALCSFHARRFDPAPDRGAFTARIFLSGELPQV